MIGELTIVRKNQKTTELHEKAKELYYNQGRSIEDIANELYKSERTIYRWLNLANQELSPVSHQTKKKSGRPKIYPPEVINRIIELKKELPQRTAPLVHIWLKKELPDACPSISYIRKIIRDQGLSNKTTDQNQG
jgi:transposase